VKLKTTKEKDNKNCWTCSYHRGGLWLGCRWSINLMRPRLPVPSSHHPPPWQPSSWPELQWLQNQRGMGELLQQLNNNSEIYRKGSPREQAVKFN